MKTWVSLNHTEGSGGVAALSKSFDPTRQAETPPATRLLSLRKQRKDIYELHYQGKETELHETN